MTEMNIANTRAAALAGFDEARSRFERQLRSAPEESLGYLKAGDDYALGGLVHHVAAVLEHYLGVLEAMVRSDFAATEAADRPGLMEDASARAKQGMTAAELDATLREVERLHASVAAVLAGIGGGDFERGVPVRYAPGADPFPTSAADVLGWLAGHYDEHVPHIEQLLASWRASR
jgi:hypothetical protein